MNKKTIFWKDLFAETIAITILTIILSYLCAPILQFFSLQRFFQQSSGDNEFTSSYFQNVYAKTHENEADSSIVTIVNTGYLTRRGDIANLLQDIHSMSPMKIGVDILFRDCNNREDDSLLTSVVKSIKDNTTFVCGIDINTEKVVHSFFCNPENKDYYVDSISEGLSELLLDNDNKSIINYKFKDIIEKDTINTFAAELTKDYYNISDVADEDYIIQYKKIGFDVLDYDSLIEDKIHGKIVLVGTMDDGQDQHGSPIGVLSGLEVHGQIVNMIFEGISIEKASWLYELVFSAICLLIFVFFLVFFDHIGDYYKTKHNMVWASFFQEIGCLPFGLSVLFIIITGAISYMAYANHGKLISMGSALLGVTVLALFSKSVVRFIIIYFNNKKHN